MNVLYNQIKVIEDFDNYKESSHYFIKTNDFNKIKLIKILKSLYNNFNIFASNSAGNPSLSKNELIKI